MDKNATYDPSEAMQTNQAKGSAWRKKKGKASSNTKYTKKSFSQTLSQEEVKALYAFLNKQAYKIDKYNLDSDGMPTDDYIDWLESGGQAGLAWATKTLQDKAIVKSKTAISQEEIEAPTEDRWTKTSVVKSVEPTLRQATFLVLEPQDDDYMTSDLHEDWYNEDEIRKGCRSFNKFCMKASLLHLMDTNGFSFVESYITPAEFVLGDSFIKKGSWLATIYCESDYIWKGVLDGTFNGLSIQCFAAVGELDD